MAWKKKPSKKKKDKISEIYEKLEGSANRRTLELNVDKIKDEIERERQRNREKMAEPEARMAPEDLKLFKRKDELKQEVENPQAEPVADMDANPEAETDEIELPSLSKLKAETEEIELPSLGKIKAAAEGKLEAAEADKPPTKTIETLEAEMAEAEAKIQRLDTGETPVAPKQPLAADAGTFEPVEAEIEHVEPGGLVALGPKVTRWQRFLGAGKQRQIMIGLGALIGAAVIGALLWYTRGWREWTGNLIVFSIPVLIVLTYVLEYFSQDRFWEDYKHIKFLRKENRADAVVLIPLVMFMGLVGLYSYMSFGQAFVHYIRFIAIATGVWMGLIWLTRRVPPYRKKDE